MFFGSVPNAPSLGAMVSVATSVGRMTVTVMPPRSANILAISSLIALLVP